MINNFVKVFEGSLQAVNSRKIASKKSFFIKQDTVG